ncbi:hypothetical protein M2360_004888 [Rhizobium sp. SG_E_25_P2]|uniref:hypothetical protein n=1 Tax=Rhizobium sp. SG_E_25_P2 TaxID=2879942 RepID=UPI002472FBD6|nr:hypothetical protein [Rhizobium sp. SG_E_25_P2]MDH6269460.1 hypothetical protein [Rhizobium sp. SG_E_25_P2]
MVIHIEEAIIRLRKHRNVLRIDDAVTGYLESAKFVDRAWFVDSAQIETRAEADAKEMREAKVKAKKKKDNVVSGPERADILPIGTTLYEAPKKNPTAEQLKDERNSALLAKLSLPKYRNSKLRNGAQYTRSGAIAQLQADARAFYRDGYLPHEREEIEKLSMFKQRRLPPAVSHETLRVENSLTQKRRGQMRRNGLTVAEPIRDTKEPAPPLAKTLSTSPYSRARDVQRPDDERTLKFAMMDVVDWVKNVPKHSRDAAQHERQLLGLERRYSVDTLPLVDPFIATSSRGGRLAAAIAAGEQGTSNYDSFDLDPHMALSALIFLGPKV